MEVGQLLASRRIAKIRVADYDERLSKGDIFEVIGYSEHSDIYKLESLDKSQDIKLIPASFIEAAFRKLTDMEVALYGKRSDGNR